MGGVLEQRTNGVWRPLGFFSRKLRTPRKTKYSTFDRELLAAHLAIRHFRYFLEGRHFTLYTDQDSLVPALCKSADAWTSRQQNQLSAISEYTTDLRHIAGKNNPVADALSRITIEAVELAQGVDYHAMALAQTNDDDIIHLRNDPATGLRLENVRLDLTTCILCDTSTGVQRPVVPALFRRRVFDVIHGLSHPGIRTSGPGSLQTSPPGPGPAFHASDPRCTATSGLQLRTFAFHRVVLPTFTLMLSGPYHRLKDSHICSPSSTVSRDGRKPFL